MADGGRGRRIGCSLGALLVVVLMVLGLGWWLGREGGLPGGGGGEGTPEAGPGSTQQTPERTQPADCPDVELIAVPGTWESTPTDDPVHPHTLPNALLLTVTNPLQDEYDTDRLSVYTVPYTAQFRNPQRPTDVTYDDSRREGTDKARARIAATHEHCPYTGFALLGFSQGAVIAGDLASEIGTGAGPVAAPQLLSAVLVADGRRQAGVGQSAGLSSGNGQGMEISLQPATGLTQMIAGATMTGPRPGGFGEAAERVVEVCAADDLICNAPLNVVDGAARFGEFLNNNAVHAQYATNPNVVAGTTTPAWAVEHLSGVVDGAEHIPHN